MLCVSVCFCLPAEVHCLEGWVEFVVSEGISHTPAAPASLKSRSSRDLLPDDDVNCTRYMAQSLGFAKTYFSVYVSSSASTNFILLCLLCWDRPATPVQCASTSAPLQLSTCSVLRWASTPPSSPVSVCYLSVILQLMNSGSTAFKSNPHLLWLNLCLKKVPLHPDPALCPLSDSTWVKKPNSFIHAFIWDS